MDDRQKVRAGKIAAFVVGGIAIVLGILFQGMNVTFLVGLAFAVAASANLPAIVMLLFWKRTTAKGIAASIIVGIVVVARLILLSPELLQAVRAGPADGAHPARQSGHHLDPAELPHPGGGLAPDPEESRGGSGRRIGGARRPARGRRAGSEPACLHPAGGTILTDNEHEVRVNFHCHSILSDGVLPPEALAARLADAGVVAASLTDHDTVDGLAPFLRVLSRRGVGFITGLELTTMLDGREVHLLAYGFDPANAELQETLRSLRHARQGGVDGIASSLRRHGSGSPSEAGRAHPRSAAPDGLIGTADAIALVHRAGGRAFLAHPFVLSEDPGEVEDIARALKEFGLDGLEALYAHTPPRPARSFPNGGAARPRGERRLGCPRHGRRARSAGGHRDASRGLAELPPQGQRRGGCGVGGGPRRCGAASAPQPAQAQLRPAHHPAHPAGGHPVHGRHLRRVPALVRAVAARPQARDDPGTDQLRVEHPRRVRARRARGAPDARAGAGDGQDARRSSCATAARGRTTSGCRTCTRA